MATYYQIGIGCQSLESSPEPLAMHAWNGCVDAGCATGEIYLCQFGETKAKAGYTPMPAHLEAPAPSPQSLFTTPPKSWNPSPGVNFTHWGQPQAVSALMTFISPNTHIYLFCLKSCISFSVTVNTKIT